MVRLVQHDHRTTIGARFLLIIGSQVRALVRPPSSVSDTTPNRAFLRGFSATHLWDFGLCGRSRILVRVFGAPSLHPKSPFPAATPWTRSQPPSLQQSDHSRTLGPGRNCDYSGLSPSASNCWRHSVGGSRSRSTPMPRGRRPSTAALTRLGARKASEMALLTCRTLHFSRVQS
jgi:hypothetical protein